MKSPKGGIKEAAKLLAGLDFENREKVLEIIFKEDPVMADLLRQSMVLLEDLNFLTVKMIQELLRDIQIEDLGLTLRICNQDLRDHFLNNISSRLKEEVLEILNGPPRPVEKVQEAADRILEVVRKKVDKGEIVLNKDGSEEYV